MLTEYNEYMYHFGQPEEETPPPPPVPDEPEEVEAYGYYYIDREGNKRWTEDFEVSIGEMWD